MASDENPWDDGQGYRRRRGGKWVLPVAFLAVFVFLMIAFVTGRVAQLAPDGVVVEVGGVGLSVQCTPGTLAALRVGEITQLPTSLIVREDSLTLYGFLDEDEEEGYG